jgi:hypothetical protein
LGPQLLQARRPLHDVCMAAHTLQQVDAVHAPDAPLSPGWHVWAPSTTCPSGHRMLRVLHRTGGGGAGCQGPMMCRVSLPTLPSGWAGCSLPFTTVLSRMSNSPFQARTIPSGLLRQMYMTMAPHTRLLQHVLGTHVPGPSPSAVHRVVPMNTLPVPHVMRLWYRLHVTNVSLVLRVTVTGATLHALATMPHEGRLC